MASVPMLPPPPALLSTMMVWPSSVPMMRETWRERFFGDAGSLNDHLATKSA